MALEVACSEQLSPTDGVRSRTHERQAGEILWPAGRVFIIIRALFFVVVVVVVAHLPALTCSTLSCYLQSSSCLVRRG
ncbi:hypothetical protein AOQ84DRAFT_43671 [Glonium stellatum]|uniref:Uncharacterized protein n=1 Tax=Glonium stellatum TaxID=574774 RepID=A0A8E2FBT1_9PEZI|nr:hypothetical protein AOQ84DRAFT_43671 [Glonium stellatum]